MHQSEPVLVVDRTAVAAEAVVAEAVACFHTDLSKEIVIGLCNLCVGLLNQVEVNPLNRSKLLVTSVCH